MRAAVKTRYNPDWGSPCAAGDSAGFYIILTADEDIHPFADGNGRTARLLMNLILVNKGYCIVSIPPILRQDYVSALKLAQREKNPSDEEFISLIAECELEAQRDYCRLLRIELPKE